MVERASHLLVSVGVCFDGKKRKHFAEERAKIVGLRAGGWSSPIESGKTIFWDYPKKISCSSQRPNMKNNFVVFIKMEFIPSSEMECSA